jgi:hypothetical protein
MASGDPALDEIRARRLAELQAQYGGGVRAKYVLAIRNSILRPHELDFMFLGSDDRFFLRF